jgi:hypothetical protein
MKDTIYLVLTAKGVNRMLKTQGALNPKQRYRRTLGLRPGERAVRVDVTVPDVAFAPPGVGHVKIDVGKDQLTTPVAIGEVVVKDPPEIVQPSTQEVEEGDVGTQEGAP